MSDKPLPANCALGRGTRMYRKKTGDSASRLSWDPKRHCDPLYSILDGFSRFPHSSRECSESNDTFFHEYLDFLSIDSEATEIEDSIAANACECCPKNGACPESHYHPYTKLFEGKVKTTRLPLAPPSETRGRHGSSIMLKDVRMNGYKVKLKLTHIRYTDEIGKEVQISLAPVRFLSFGITTRLAIAIADLYQNHSESLIAQGFGVSTRTLERIIKSWQDLDTITLNPDHIFWSATGTLGDTIVEFIVDATEMTLCGIRFIKKTITKYWSPPSSMNFVVFGTIPDAESLEPKPFSYNDVHALLEEVFQFSWKTSQPRVGFAETEDLYETFSKELDTLKSLCRELTALLRSFDPNDSALALYREKLTHQLRVLVLLANSPDQNGAQMLPLLGNVANRFLKQWLQIATDPEDYKQGDPSRFSGSNRQKLALLLEFLHAVKQASEGNRNIRAMCHRLTLFNEPASIKVMHCDQTEEPLIASAFSCLKPEDFYQPHIHINPPRLSCLMHLIEHGLLDTNSPVVNLPCAKARLAYGRQAGCSAEHCPILDRHKT